MDILRGLNEKQREAAITTEGYVRIIAGAGSGKTKALTHRYAYLVRAAGIHPGNVLCVTFTNKAAGEMKRRVRMLAGDGFDTSLITTYHGFCVRVLREDIGRLFWAENFTILDEGDQKRILEEIYRELGLKLDHASFEKLLDEIDALKATTDYVDIMLRRGADDYTPLPTLDQTIIKRYMLRQKKIFGLDFNDLINFVFVLFDRFPEVRQSWQERLAYIQVDEFQDSSKRELKLIDTLSAVNRNLFVVGDPDQNIYEWRGAEVGILVGFDKTHPGTKTVLMEQNYRSTGNILRVANTLIAHNINRIAKTLFTDSGSGADVIHLHCKNEDEESAAIVAQIRALTGKEGFTLRDIAVMYRSGFLSQFIEKAFTAEGIPYDIFGSVRFFERMEIIDAIAYLRLIDRDDDNALIRIVNKPRRGFGRTKADKLKQLAALENISLFEALVKYSATPELSAPQAAGLCTLILELREKKDETPVSQLLQRVLTESGYEGYIREAGNMERFDNLSEFKKITLENERAYGKTSLEDNMPPEFMPLSEYIAQLDRAGEENLEDAVDRVKLMTIHAAKGLEFPVCIIVGMTEGIFPSGRTVEERKQAGLEEERRLCFVALTRAMKRLYLTDSEGSGQNGRKKLPSRFFSEMGEDNFVRIGAISKDVAALMKSAPAEYDPEPERLGVGSRVNHAVFGDGEIIALDEKRGAYTVRFDSGAVRPISTDYDFGKWRGLLEETESDTPGDTSPDYAESAVDDIAPDDITEPDDTPEPDDMTEPDDTSEPVDMTEPDDTPEPDDMTETVDTSEPVDMTEPDDTPEPDDISESDNTAGDRLSELAARLADIKAALEENEKGEPVERPAPKAGNSLFAGLGREIGAKDADKGVDTGIDGDTGDTGKDIDISMPETPESSDFGGGEAVTQSAPEKTPKPSLTDTENLWKRDDVPHSGWSCISITDLGAPTGVCGMCGKQIIRYVHHMRHPDYPRVIGAGCVCAGKMEGDEEGARRRENDFKQRESRRETFIHHARKRSRNGNEYFKYNGEIVTLLRDKFRQGYYKAVWRGMFTQPRPTPEEALADAFELIK